jgi:gamma-glutamyltranspeptidase
VTRYGIVAAENPIAAQVGTTILADDGNAVDAAIATNAMMGLNAPMSNGIGGDLFAIIYEVKSGKLYGLNASGWAPAGLSINKGEIAKLILACSRQHGETLTPSDLAEFSSEWVEPISTTYRGWSVSEIPPNGQGIAALMMLNIMENFPLSQYGHNSAAALHVMIEAKKLAYADMLRYVADQRFSKVPVRGMLDKRYANGQV